ncbi:hypothetical protein GCM10007148_01330 [Parvularcula lutaonensis]|nr:hypothetical protein GCM10007148_01330 [Parvularcula lutaonensis]
MLVALGVWVALNIVTLPIYLFTGLKDLASGENTVAAAVAERGLAPDVLLLILLLAGVKTALTEEILFRAAIFLLPGAAGWLMGWLNEKVGNGSIFPGWLMHALGNAVSLTFFAAS